MLTCVEICAGAGGQALGLERAGFHHVVLVEYEKAYCEVLRRNRPQWNVLCEDVRKIGAIRPRAVLLENVRGFLDKKFDGYRAQILGEIISLGYRVRIKLINASDFGVSQLRPRVIIVGIRNDERGIFSFPMVEQVDVPTVGELLKPLMGKNNWRGLDAWVERANKIAPTIVGGSKKHGGPDLGPVRARRAWAELGVDGNGVANDSPDENFDGMPRLTAEMLALLQGFPSDWEFGRRKTSACRMIGNALPPPVAERIGIAIRRCLEHGGGADPRCSELLDAVKEISRQGREDIIETLVNLIDGKRLKDISDLPLDLSC